MVWTAASPSEQGLRAGLQGAPENVKKVRLAQEAAMDALVTVWPGGLLQEPEQERRQEQEQETEADAWLTSSRYQWFSLPLGRQGMWRVC